MKKQNNIILYGIVLYVIFPSVLYPLLKLYVGKYREMIIQTISGILYTVFSFWYTKQFNVTGLWALKDILFASIQWWLLYHYGTKAYYSRTILFTIGGYVFGIFMAAGYFYIDQKVNKVVGQR
jgi:hypothetical protein